MISFKAAIFYHKIDNLPPQMTTWYYPHSNALFQNFIFQTKLLCTTSVNSNIARLYYDVRFLTVNHRIHCRKFLKSSSQTLH